MAEFEEPYTADDYIRAADFIACAGLVAGMVGGAEVALSVHFIDTDWVEALAVAPGVAIALGGVATFGYGIFHVFRGDRISNSQ